MSAWSATAIPNDKLAVGAEVTSLCSSDQETPDRTNTYAAPVLGSPATLSPGVPTSSESPSRDTEVPKAPPVDPEERNSLASWDHTAPLLEKTCADPAWRPTPVSSPGAPTTSESPDTDTDVPK